jgi:hypothetical protein
MSRRFKAGVSVLAEPLKMLRVRATPHPTSPRERGEGRGAYFTLAQKR